MPGRPGWIGDWIAPVTPDSQLAFNGTIGRQPDGDDERDRTDHRRRERPLHGTDRQPEQGEERQSDGDHERRCPPGCP